MRMRHQTNSSRERRGAGQALVETAIILPVLLLMMLAAVEMGRAAYTDIVVVGAAHAGALYGAQNNANAANDAGMEQAAKNDGAEVNGLTAVATHVCACSSGASAPDCSLSDCVGSRLLEYVQVKTSAVFTPMCSYPGLPAAMTLHGQAVVAVSR